MEHRPIYEIAAEIKKEWTKPYFGAVPYLEAMNELVSVKENYYADSAASVIRYFLANASTWRGEKAREIKAELKTMIKGRY